MRGIRTYRTVVAIVFTLAFLAYANLHGSVNYQITHGTSKAWGKDMHELFHPVLLTKHLKVKTSGYQLVKKSEPDKFSPASVYGSFNRLLPYGHINFLKFRTGISLHKFNRVLLI